MDASTRAVRNNNKTTVDNPKDDLYFMDIVGFMVSQMKNPTLEDVTHYGMQILADTGKELFMSSMWGSSILCASGDHVLYSGGEPIFPGDVVHYKDDQGKERMGLILQVCRDQRTGFQEQVMVRIGELRSIGELVGIGETLPDPLNIRKISNFVELVNELMSKYSSAGPYFDEVPVLIEDSSSRIFVPVSRITSTLPMIPIFTDGTHIYPEELDSLIDPIGRPSTRCKVAIPLILNTFRKLTLRLSGKRRPLRAELELLAYGYDKIVDIFVQKSAGKVYVLPQISFTDGFGLNRQGDGVYCSMLGCYFTLANLPLHYRQSIKH